MFGNFFGFGSSGSGGGSMGTVTSFTFIDANGFSGSVLNANTNPELTLSVTTTENYLIKTGGSGAIVDSLVQDDGTGVGILGAPQANIGVTIYGTGATVQPLFINHDGVSGAGSLSAYILNSVSSLQNNGLQIDVNNAPENNAFVVNINQDSANNTGCLFNIFGDSSTNIGYQFFVQGSNNTATNKGSSITVNGGLINIGQEIIASQTGASLANSGLKLTVGGNGANTLNKAISANINGNNASNVNTGAEFIFGVATTVGNTNIGVKVDMSAIVSNNPTKYGFISTGNALHGFNILTPTAYGDFSASTTTNASIRLRAGTAPTSPNDGDLWLTSTHIFARIGGVSYQLDQQGGGTVTSVSGTANRITSTGGATPVIDIAATYVGQTSITTLGTIATGTWNATTISIAKGGTNNTAQVTNGVNYFDGTIIKSLATFLFDGTNLGIGATPQSLLTVSRQTTIQAPVTGSSGQFVGLDANPLRITFDTHNNSSASGTALMGRRSRGTSATPLAIAADDVIFSINGRGYGTTGYGAASTGLVTINAAQIFTDTNQGTYVSISTTPNNSITAAEALRVTGSGQINAIQAAGVYQINSTNVLSATTLGSGVVNSSLTSVGTIATGVWNGTVIAPNFGGTGVANNAASTLTISGNFATTITVSAITSVTLPTSGTLYGTLTGSITSAQLAGSLSDDTGFTAGALAVFNTSPNFVTSVIGGASFDVFNTTSTTINAFGAATTLAIGNTATAAQTVNMFTASTGASTYNFATGATTNGTTKTINIATVGVSGSITNINIGSAVAGATGTITLNENALFTDHIGIGNTATISATALINFGETYASGSGNVTMIAGTATLNTSANDTLSGINVNTVMNATGGSTTHTLVGATNLTAIGATSTANWAAGAFKGQTIRMRTITGQTGTIADAIWLELAAGTWGAGKPTAIMGLNILNLGITGTTTSTGIVIAAQSGSTSNFAITSASGNLHGWGTPTPVECMDVSGNVQLKTIGNKFKIKEGTNASAGVATLSAGTIVVNNNIVTANTRIKLTVQSLGTVTVPTAVAITARSAGVSFTITSANVVDTSVVYWEFMEPAP